jgi:hypothetical protein
MPTAASFLMPTAASASVAASVGMKPIVLFIQCITPLLAILDAHGHMPELHFV